MPNVNITVRNKIATGEGTKIVCGNSDYIAVFDFDEEWSAYPTKTMRVEYGNSYTDVVFSGNSAEIPVVQNVFGIKIGVYAGSLRTTTPAYFDSIKSILCDSGMPVQPTPSVYEQIITLLNSKANENQGAENAGKYWRVAEDGSLVFAAGGGGTNNHAALINRDLPNQHPMSAITGLEEALDGKQPSGDYATTQELDALADIVDGKADAADIPSLDGYATEEWVEGKGYLTEHQSLAAYRTASAQDIIDASKQDKLIAGANITIAEDGKTISATGGGGGSADTQWNGKTAIFFGDSLTEQNQHYTKGYHSWIKDILGLTSYVNKGQSGKNLSGIYNQIYGTPETADLICVMGGVNDQTASVPLGQMGDTGLTTTYGCVYNICNLLNSKFPTSRKVFITPHFQTKYPHSGGITSYEISKAIKEVCEKFSVAVYDNFVMCEIRADNLSVFTVDNCHWNDRGHELVGKNVAKWLLDKFRYVYTGASVAVTGVTLNKNSTTITEGSTETLTATVAPANATNKAVTWATSSAAVATVNNGVVTAVSEGSANITVTTVDGGFTATCAVTVEASAIVVTGITLNKNATTITEGTTETLTATLQPSGATGTITWTTSDDTKATVANGVVTAVAEGNATITASCEGFYASCVVTVEAAAPVEITVTPIANTCNAVYENNTLTLSNKTQTFYGVDFNNCKKLTATNLPAGNHWIAAKRSNGTYCGFMLVTQNQQGLLYANITPTLSNFGAGQTLIDSSEPPITGVTSSVEVQIVGGALVIKIDGTVINTKITDTSFVALAYTTSVANTWSGLTLE